MITDTHAHVFWKTFDDDREAMLARARSAGVERMIVPGTEVDTSRAAFELCAREPGLFPSAGLHPHDASSSDSAARTAIAELSRRDDAVAVGETGLDFFKEYSPRAAQLENFRWHLELARALDKPVIVHCRDAHEETLAALRGVPGVRGVMHCYTMGAEELPGYLDLGFYISFSGVVTYPKNERNQAAARAVPIERLLVETDAPYLAPQGRRGARNEPAFVRGVLDELVRVRGTTFDALARRTSENAAELFRLPAP
ncbi:MAG: TatD family hydrolase [Planctomycetes bacterium]|nr:TatD family hydrolase [Planctomycetota bacterium]